MDCSATVFVTFYIGPFPFLPQVAVAEIKERTKNPNLRIPASSLGSLAQEGHRATLIW